jgi:hypothetical protein
MNAFQIALLLYAVIIAAGGVMGYVAAQSVVSLVNGLVAAVILLVGLAISFKNPTAGFGLSAVVALALAALLRLSLLHHRQVDAVSITVF